MSRRAALPQPTSELESAAMFMMKAEKLPAPVPEFKFLDDRRFRFDFAWPAQKVALECEGGVWTGGRHTQGAAFEKDCEKYSLAAAHGWLVIRATNHQIESGDFILWVRRALELRGGA